MPLQQLVEYFNDRLEREHNSGFRPFILQDGKVQGMFGPIRIGTQLSPVRHTNSGSQLIGHAAQLTVTTANTATIQSSELDNLLQLPAGQVPNPESIISFDRLSRAVHMLNYLPQSHLQEILFLDVDPRHILGVKEDHGAYFEEVIIKCGLETRNVAICLTVNRLYARFYQSLLKGLNNYQRRGYRLALKFEDSSLDKQAIELISRAAPDYVGLSAEHLQRVRESQITEILKPFTTAIHALNAQSILLNVHDLTTAELAFSSDFDLLQGEDIYLPVNLNANNFQHANL